MRRWTWMAAVAAMAASFLPPPVAAQTSEAVGTVTTIDGRATVARRALPSPLALKFKDDVFGRDRISTQENSLVRVLLGGKAILTVRELSQVTISEEPGRAVVTLPDGKVVLAVAKQRMRPGESIEIRTPNAVAAVRGSILAVGFAAATGATTAFCAAGIARYQQGTGPTVPLPVGQALHQRPAAAGHGGGGRSLANVQTTARAATAPEQITTAVFQEQASQATQVAQFVTTGTVTGAIGTVTSGGDRNLGGRRQQRTDGHDSGGDRARRPEQAVAVAARAVPTPPVAVLTPPVAARRRGRICSRTAGSRAASRAGVSPGRAERSRLSAR